MKKWREEGVTVALIGNGNASFAEAFREDFELEGPILIDPELGAYRAAGLRRGASAVASPRLLANGLRAMRAGARQTAVQGDPWQLGGVFVLSGEGDLRFAFRSETAGDHATPEEISAALEADAPNLDEQDEESTWAGLARLTRPVLDLSPVGSFDRIGFARHAAGFDPNDLDVDLYGQRCLVTGANAGIGYETALALADLGAEVELLCRNKERGEAAVAAIREATGNRRVRMTQVDLSSLAEIDRAVEKLSQEPIDVLVHNAGLLPDERVETADGLELTFATHVAGPHRLTAGLRGALEEAESARVIWVSSGGMLTRRLNLRDPQWKNRDYDGVVAYAETKRAQVVLAELWAREFEGTSVCVNSMHPGWADTAGVKTSLPRFHRVTEAVLRTPAEGADTVVWLAASEAAEGRTGEFFFDRESVRTHWLASTKESEADREALWELCSRFEKDRQNE
jgi:NAD(P)-dependent dehydrogenase (short-subunit alcohol dehydrogenase family)